MKFVTFSHAGVTHAGAIVGDHVLSLSEAGIAGSILEIVRGGISTMGRVESGLTAAPSYPRADVRLEAPIVPGKILCSGINYKAHAEENPNANMPTEPFFFAKLPSSVVGPDTPVEKSTRTDQMDYEVEFAIVIGNRLYKAAEADVMPAVFGYTLLNDISARDVQFKDNQITLGKNLAGYAPIGPCIVSADEMPDPTNVGLRTRLNGRILQNGNTSDWLFSLPFLISFLSHIMPLEPGDIVTTGTPAGWAYSRNPRFS